VWILDPLTVREGQDGIAEVAVISIALTCQQAPTWGAEGVCPIDRPPLMEVRLCYSITFNSCRALKTFSIVSRTPFSSHLFLCRYRSIPIVDTKHRSLLG